MTKGDKYEIIKTANEKAPKPKARLPLKRGAIKVRIFKLLGEKLVSLCQSVFPPPTGDLREAEAGASTSKNPSVVSPYTQTNDYI
ncbi:hypothetical protein CDL15_Pgr025981 [Punica granatum]|uniref:Uncharacterized protein n=1 Tax=Punica granatum TaxID=22663 RepID=A0A218WD51_PUNGR|nr:hypothetical protein CDL15_Pgr025981 [Punica granatum]